MMTCHRHYIPPLHSEHDPKLQKADNTNDATKIDDDGDEEIKTADLPMAESREQTDYKTRRSNRNGTVEPQAGSEAVKVVKTDIDVMGIAGSRCSSCTNCECAYNRLQKICIACNAGCKAKHGVLNVNWLVIFSILFRCRVVV